MQLNKTTRLDTVSDKNYSVASALTNFKKSTDNSVSVEYHKVTHESNYDIVNKECYEKDCSKGTSSNKKMPSRPIRRKLLFDITPTQSNQIIGNEVNHECVAKRVNNENIDYRKNGSRNLFNRSISMSDTSNNNAVNACSENENNEVFLYRYFDGEILDRSAKQQIQVDGNIVDASSANHINSKNGTQECPAKELSYRSASKSTKCSTNVIDAWSANQQSNENEELFVQSAMETILKVLYFHNILKLVFECASKFLSRV